MKYTEECIFCARRVGDVDQASQIKYIKNQQILKAEIR